MFTLAFWKATAERMVRGGAIAASLVWPLSAWTSIDESVSSLGLVALAFVWGAGMSLLLSLAGSQIGEKGEPSFTGNEIIAPAPSLPQPVEPDPTASGDDLDPEG